MSWQAVRCHHLLGLAAILLLAIGVRCYHLGGNSLWTDEYLSMECSSGWGRSDLSFAGADAPIPDLISLKNAKPWNGIWVSIGDDENHPPLYFLRSLSVVAAAIAIILLFAIGVVVHSPRVALWACLLMAVASPQIEQSQDARAYMPLTAVCLAAALAVVCIDRAGPTRWRCITLFLAVIAAPMLHYMAFATMAALVIYAIFVMRGAARKSVLLTMSAALATYAALWGPQLLSQHYRIMDGTAWMIDDPANHAISTLKNLCMLPARLFLDLDGMRFPVACLSASLFLFPLLLCPKERALRLWWIWLMVPALTALVIDLATGRQSLSMIRYTLVAAPAVNLMLGLFAVRVRCIGWIPPALIAAGCIACIPTSYSSAFPDWRELSRCILQNSRPGDPVIFVDDDPQAYSSDGALSTTYYLAGQNRPLYILNHRLSGSLLDQLSGARHVCVVASNGACLAWAQLPGMKMDHAEMLVGIALVGTEDRVPEQ